MTLESWLQDGIVDLAVIRTTLETREVFPDDQALQSELDEIITGARSLLLRRLRDAANAVGTAEPTFRRCLEAFRDEAVRAATHGVSDPLPAEGPRLHGTKPLRVYFELPGHWTPQQSARVPAARFAAAVLEDLARRASDEPAFTDRVDFDRRVMRPYVLALFIAATTNDGS